MDHFMVVGRSNSKSLRIDLNHKGINFFGDAY